MPHSENMALKPICSGICDGCGKQREKLFAVDCAPAAGLVICDVCLDGNTDTKCPTCGVTINYRNASGYRTFCDACCPV